jgi:hypothetical protein
MKVAEARRAWVLGPLYLQVPTIFSCKPENLDKTSKN